MAGFAPGSAGPAAPTPWLVRLYPAAWRARYGDEFAELLAARPPALRDRVDIAVGALDARLRPQLETNPAAEVPALRDRPVSVLAILAGAFLVFWVVSWMPFMVAWGAGDPVAPAEVMLASQLAQYVGALLAVTAILTIAVRYQDVIGGAGVGGAMLAALGLVLAALGGGLAALVALGAGTILFCVGARGRVLGTATAVAFVTTTMLTIGVLVAFIAGNGQDPSLLWLVATYGVGWVVLGLGLRPPAPRLVHA